MANAVVGKPGLSLDRRGVSHPALPWPALAVAGDRGMTAALSSEMIVGIGVPRPVDLEGPRGLTALGVAQIRRDNAVFVPELLEGVERVGREPRDRRIQPAAGKHQQRKAGTNLIVMDANIAFFVERHRILLAQCGVILCLRAHLDHPGAYRSARPRERGTRIAR
jgi:hypothetical protein